MRKLLKRRINVGFLVNPFYLYSIAFSLSILLYLWRWSNIFPELSGGLILFFGITFVLFWFAGYKLGKRDFIHINDKTIRPYLMDIIFGMIIILGIINLVFMGYLPILDSLHNYREFGMPVIDPLFNTLSIFFSIYFFQSYMVDKNKRFLIYVFIILIIQILLFRRSTIVWIITSSFFLFVLYKRKINLVLLMAGIICIPLFSYCFGLYGNTRSNITKSNALNELGASDTFQSTGISHNHYMTYLYVSSPLANLQENIVVGDRFFNTGDIKDFFSIV